MNCRHCYKPNLGEIDLSLEQIKTILAKLSLSGIRHLLFTGGEPLLRKDLFEIIDCAIHYDFEDIAINTNGLLLRNSKILDQIRERSDIISCLPVSFDGARSETHDFIRGEGQFKKLMSILEPDSMRNIPIGLNVTIGRWNFHDLEEFFAIYDKLNANDINFGIFIPLGRGVTLKEQVLTSEQCETLIQFAKQKHDAGYLVQLCSLPYAKLYEPTISGSCCNIFTEFITITAQGNVVPCILYEYNLGSLLEMELKDILSNPLVKIFQKTRKLRKKMTGYCSTCSKIKICRGGCNLLTYALTGNIFASDPLCPLPKKT
jgi:radical SAM protein with 4Fe4S-binding SPASM domain